MLLFLLLSHLPSSPSLGACWQLSEINFLKSTAPGGAEALKQSDLVPFSCLCFLTQPMTVRWTCSCSLVNCTCTAPWRGWQALLHLPRCLISSQECFCWELTGPSSLQLRSFHTVNSTSCVSGSCCCWKATWITKGQLLITEILTFFYPCLCNLVLGHFAWRTEHLSSLCHSLSADVVVPAAVPSLCSNGKLHFVSWALLVIKPHHKMSHLILPSVPILSSAPGKCLLVDRTK